jgi:hypothetical protein
MLRPGISGKGWVSFKDFKAAVFSAARAIRATVVNAEPAGVTPNFHSAVLDAPDGEIVVLCNSRFPIVAFAEAPVGMGSLRFKDHDALRDAMESIGGYAVANVAELGGRSGIQLVRLSGRYFLPREEGREGGNPASSGLEPAIRAFRSRVQSLEQHGNLGTFVETGRMKMKIGKRHNGERKKCG